MGALPGNCNKEPQTLCDWRAMALGTYSPTGQLAREGGPGGSFGPISGTNSAVVGTPTNDLA